MIKCTANNSEAQAQRLQIKTIHRQMENLAVAGAAGKRASWSALLIKFGNIKELEIVFYHDYNHP